LQFFEIVFLLLLTVSIVRLLFGAIHPLLNYAPIASIGLALIVLGVIFEGWRWQMLPAYLGFAALMLASLKRSGTKRSLRVVGALPLIILLVASAFLTHQLPIRSLPTPTGPYAVGTFDYKTTDTSRPEPYATEHQRELYVEVWYPADKIMANDFPVSTLAQEFNGDSYDERSFLFGYLKHISTHAHVQAPVATLENGSIPVLLFNHGANLGFTSQNLLLM